MNLYLGLLKKRDFDLGASQAFFATGQELARRQIIDSIYKIVKENGFVNITNSGGEKIKLIPNE